MPEETTSISLPAVQEKRVIARVRRVDCPVYPSPGLTHAHARLVVRRTEAFDGPAEVVAFTVRPGPGTHFPPEGGGAVERMGQADAFRLYGERIRQAARIYKSHDDTKVLASTGVFLETWA